MAILVLGWVTSSVGTSMMGHNYMVEETAFGNLGQGAFTKKQTVYYIVILLQQKVI